MRLWIARDKDGSLNLYDNIPDKRSEYFLPYAGYDDMPLDERLLPGITFENSPQEVKLVSENISESIVNEFMNTLNFTYDKSEKCMVAKMYNSDLTSLKDIIESKL
jgi:hypothetical protein